MGRPTSLVELYCDGLNRKESFPFEQAQGMLRLQEKKKFKQKGYSVWELPSNSKFYFEDGDLRRKSDNRANKEKTSS